MEEVPPPVIPPTPAPTAATASPAPLSPTPQASAVGGNPPVEPPQEGTHHPHQNFWQKKWVQDGLPFGTSLAIHLAVLLLGFLALRAAQKFVLKDTSKEEIVIPDSQLAQDGDLGGIPNPGLDNDPTRQAKQDNDPTVTESKSWADRKSDSLNNTLQGGGADGGDMIARGEGAGPGRGASTGGGIGAGIGTGQSEGGGDEAAFGPKGGGGGIGPQSKIFGHGGNVRSIIYVTDGSGSLVGGKDEVLRVELKKAVTGLSPIQAFNVLVFQDVPGGFLHPDGFTHLMMATPNDKAKLFDFVDNTYTFHGGTNVLPALDEAFNEQPQLIYLLTDGLFEDTGGQAVIDKIAARNPDKKVRVNSILLLGSKKEDDDPDIKTAIENMKTIASQNGGVFELFHADEF